ncbi:MAG: hypothetical protein HZB61_02015 [Nitrospirae bacterium]|nr:hypothetical protein [Nitrospirota bacterium]
MNIISKIWAEKDWIMNYAQWALFEHKPVQDDIGTIHIMVLFVDHFEPKIDRLHGIRVTDDVGMKRWMAEYPMLASKHKDSDGKHPQHTWFYPYDYMNMEHLRELSMLVYKGYGEIELHLHHKNDTSESLEAIIKDAVRKYNTIGALRTEEENTYGFIHGKWALDNCDGTCGVNDEISILLKTGCYADFGLPAQNRYARTKKINKIYYAIDDPCKPKSFDTGIDVAVGNSTNGGLMMIPGPLRIDWEDWRFKWHPMVEHGEIRLIRQPTESRVDLWIDTNIHIPGRPDWIFVKLFTHGCVNEDLDTLLGPSVDSMHNYLGTKYNDGKKYKLHYVTAREAYNIIKAAEAGESGNPNHYRDFIIKPYLNRKNYQFMSK